MIPVITWIRKRLAIDPRIIPLIERFRRDHRATSLPSESILVQCVEDAYFFGIFGQIASSLREKRSVRINLFAFRSLSVGESRSLQTFLITRLLVNQLNTWKWLRAYRNFCDGAAYRSTEFHPLGDVIAFYRAWRYWRRLADKESLVAMEIDGIPVGDLVNDSYLRFRPAPTVDLKDTYLLIVLWQAFRDVRQAKRCILRERPSLYLTSYCTYIQHGIPVRVALKLGVRVFSFGNLQEFTKELSWGDWVQTKNPDNYAKEFLLLDRQDDRMALAEAALFTRLSGGVDSATAYMKKSAYVKSDNPVPEVQDAVVIFLHDFYDSPHVYRGMVFPDFWEWICFTIETLKAANISCFVKPHPNQISLNEGVLSELQERYPDLVMISSEITNKQLVEAGMACAVTVYGTIAHEMAYLGVPSIACAHHPHISFDFCRTAKTRREYAELLKQSIQHPVDKISLHRESLIFYYMHNLNLTDEMMELRDALIALWVACAKVVEELDLNDMLRRMAELPGYQMQLNEMMRRGPKADISQEGR